jgi:hypothetical protein
MSALWESLGYGSVPATPGFPKDPMIFYAYTGYKLQNNTG